MGWEASAEHGGEPEQTASSHSTVHESGEHSHEHKEEENLGFHEPVSRARDITFGTLVTFAKQISKPKGSRQT